MPDHVTAKDVLIDIAELTAPACGINPECISQGYTGRYRCCLPLYCEAARRYMLMKGIVPAVSPDPVNPDLPFMSSAGCVLSPEYRPICSIHTCQWTGSSNPHCGNAIDTNIYTRLYWMAHSMDDGWWRVFESVRDSRSPISKVPASEEGGQ